MSRLAPLVRGLGTLAWLPFVLLIALSGAFVSAQLVQSSHRALSPYDEYVYVDYLAKVPTEGFVRSGAQTGWLARNELNCRGVAGYGDFGGHCDARSHSDDHEYPYDGGTGADIYAPPYFAATWAVAQPLRLLGLSLLEAGRAVGILWLALGVCGLFALIRSLGSSKAIAFGVSAAVIATPSIYWADTFVSTDAPTLATASFLGLFGVYAARRRRWAYWALPLLAALATLFKLQNLIAVGLVAVALAAWAIWERTGGRASAPSPRPRIVVAAVAAFAALAAQVGWLAVRTVSTPPGAVAAKVDSVRLPLTIHELLDEAFKFVDTLGTTGAPSGLVAEFAGAVFSILAIAASLGIVVARRSIEPRYVIVAASSLVFALAMGPLLAIGTDAEVHYYVPLPIRYGLVLIPAFAACVAIWFDRIVSARWTLALAPLGALVAIAAMV